MDEFERFEDDELERIMHEPDSDEAVSDSVIVTVGELLADEGEEEYETVVLPSGKGAVVIRELNRKEVMSVKQDVGPVEREQVMLSLALIDPVMSIREIRHWQQKRGSTKDIEKVARAVARRAGLLKGTDKSPVRNDGDDS